MNEPTRCLECQECGWKYYVNHGELVPMEADKPTDRSTEQRLRGDNAGVPERDDEIAALRARVAKLEATHKTFVNNHVAYSEATGREVASLRAALAELVASEYDSTGRFPRALAKAREVLGGDK